MIAYYVMDDRLARLFGVESLQQPPQLLETQFEFLEVISNRVGSGMWGGRALRIRPRNLQMPT